MAAGDINVVINSETKAFRQGVESGIIDPLEDAEKALDDLGKSKGPDQLERELKDAQRETEDLADETKKTARQIERSYKDAGQDIKRGIGDGLSDVKDEAAQSARESAASFSGEWDDVGDFVQETMANAFSGFGPIGAAAGIAAAAGLGTVLNALNQQQEAVEELKEKFADAYKSAAEDGRAFLDEAEIQSMAIDIYFDPEKREAARKDAEKLGVDLQTAVLAQSGDQDALAAIIAKGNEQIDKGTEKMRAKAEAGKDVFDLETANVALLEQLVGKYESILGIQKDNQQAARDVKDLQDSMAAEALEDSRRAKEADRTRWSALGEYYQKFKDKAGAGVDIPVRIDETGFNNQIRALQRRAEQGITVNVRPGQGRFYE